MVKDHPVTMRRQGAIISLLPITVTKYLRQLAHKVKDLYFSSWALEGTRPAGCMCLGFCFW